MEKKPYTPPTVTPHGAAVAVTLGNSWRNVEKIGFRGGIYEGVRGTAGDFNATTNPNGGLNPHGNPRLAGFVNFDILGSEEGAWLYHGIYWADKPILTVGVGAVYQSLSTRGPNGVTDSRMESD